MQINNENYIEGLYKFVNSDSEAVTLIEADISPCTLRNSVIHFYKEDADIILNEEQKNYFNDFMSGDVIDLSENGTVWPVFRQNGSDNTFYVTDKCNSNCIMCPIPENIRRNGLKVIPGRLYELVKYIPQNLKHVTITGGEPFLAKEDMFAVLNQLKYKCSSTEFLLLSNARAFSIQDYAKNLKETAPARFSIGIPVHGHNADLHDRITQAPGSFAQTFSGIKNLLHQNIDVEIRIVVSALNREYIDDIANLIIQEFSTVSSVKIMAMEMLGNAAVNKDIVWLPYEDFFVCVKSAIDNLVSHKIDTAIYNMPLCLVERPYWSICKQSISDYKIKYFSKCDLCSVKDACGGVFAGTYRLLEESIQPVKI